MSGTPAPVAQSVTSPFRQTQGKVVPVSVLQLIDIPTTMDKLGWSTAANLMRHWFSIKPAWAMPEAMKLASFDSRMLTASQFNSSLVKMSWLQTFPRARDDIRHLADSWATTSGRALLTTRLRRAGWSPGQRSSLSLGYGSQDPIQLDATAQVNFQTLGSKLDVLDDLYGALGISTLKLAVRGRTQFSAVTGDEFRVEKVGIYIRDTYDFAPTGFENVVPLGVWSRERCLSKAETMSYLGLTPFQRRLSFPGFVPIYNDDFRRWQRQHNAGADFVVYSDVMWMDSKIVSVAIS